MQADSLQASRRHHQRNRQGHWTTLPAPEKMQYKAVARNAALFGTQQGTTRRKGRGDRGESATIVSCSLSEITVSNPISHVRSLTCSACSPAIALVLPRVLAVAHSICGALFHGLGGFLAHEISVSQGVGAFSEQAGRPTSSRYVHQNHSCHPLARAAKIAPYHKSSCCSSHGSSQWDTVRHLVREECA